MRKLHTCCTKYVAAGKLPHSSKKLSETTTEAGHADDNIGHGNSAGADVVERKNESCRRERKQAADVELAPSTDEHVKREQLTVHQDWQYALAGERRSPARCSSGGAGWRYPFQCRTSLGLMSGDKNKREVERERSRQVTTNEATIYPTTEPSLIGEISYD